MLKVFLVEDEFVIREGIKNNIDWETHGYEFCGEAGDGELAYPMIQRLRPDIVITDIRMPFMDGLELSRLIRRELPDIEIIILSGYQEFEYAKEAIKLGVAQYLSKPINGEELLAELEELSAKIEEKRRATQIRERYLKEMEENTLRERKKLFQSLVVGDNTAAELLESAERLGIDLSAPWYNIILFKTQSLRHAQDEYSGSLIRIEEELRSLEDGTTVVSFDRNPEGKAFLLKAESEEQLQLQQQEYIEKIKDIMEKYEHVRYFGGIGRPVNRLRELPASFEQASHAFAHRYLVQDSRILDGGYLAQGTEEEHFDIKQVNPKQIDRTRIQEFLKQGDREEVVYFVEEFFRDLSNKALQSNIFRQYITMDAYFCVADFLESLSTDTQDPETPSQDEKTQQDSDSAIQYIIRILDKALEARDRAASSRYDDVVEQVMKYIEENYAEEELSLNLLASHVNFSPNHLSMIFSQQTGMSFIKYLTDYRMNKAKELLRCTGKRSSLISQEVGYKDPHYFSYLFKKTQGMTPTQYRGGIK
jgi:YesN/AraC family two-component response regulator